MPSWFLLMTGGPAADGGQQGSPFTMLIFFALIFAIFYLLIIRPQQKRQKQHSEMLAGIRNGDEVLTSGGLIGSVVGTKEEHNVQVVVLKIADNTKVEVSRTHIQQVLRKNA
jgi:preprotein translocase subunit YajC